MCVVGSFTTITAMTLLLPYLPLYVAQLGVHGRAAVVQWSAAAYSATFLTAALTAPLWGRLGDRYGRKPMLVRASLGMAVTMSLIGLVQDVWQLVALRLVVGLVGGYASGSTILVAAQTPKERSAWALGVLSAGAMTGALAGPLLGGAAPVWIGLRATFLAAGALIFLAFLGTSLLLREDRAAPGRPAQVGGTSPARAGGSRALPSRTGVLVLLATAGVLTVATMSLEPIVTVFVAQIDPGTRHVTVIAGVVMAASAVGSIVSAPRLGRVADRFGHRRVITASLAAAGVLMLAQGAVSSAWQLGVLRLAMGLCLGGLMPAVTASIRHQVPDGAVGRVLGYSVSAQYLGQVLGPTAGGLLAARAGLRSVFIATASLLLLASLVTRGTSTSTPTAPDQDGEGVRTVRED